MYDTWGRTEVVEMLEAYLRMAKEQRWGHIAIAMSGYPTMAALGDAGDIGLQELALESIMALHAQVKKQVDNWRFPEQDPSLDHSYVRYNIANGPLGFDFLTWLVFHEMYRVHNKAPAPLKVAFWRGRDELDRMNADKRKMWLEKVFRPMLPLFGAVEDETALFGHHIPVFVPGRIVDAIRQHGAKVPRLKSVLPVEETGAVTITLREKDEDAPRNSDIQAWLRFAADLKMEGERVILVRDTAKADEPIDGFETCPEASKDLHHRVALYEGAKHNFFVENGPGGLALYGEKPCTIFCGSVEKGPKMGNVGWDAENWKKSFAISIGEQFPWTLPDQRLVWKADTYENMHSTWSAVRS